MQEILTDKILAAVRGKKVGVIGDMCLDVYYFLDDAVTESSVETGLSTRSVKFFKMAPGGGANAARNISALGAKSQVFGLVGDDAFGRELSLELNFAGVDIRGLFTPGRDWVTNVFTKLYSSGSEEPRIDIGNFNVVTREMIDTILSAFEKALPGLDSLVVNDQLLQGINTSYLRERLAKFIGLRKDLPVLIDSRAHADAFPGAIRKVNVKEAQATLGEVSSGSSLSDSQIESLLERLYSRWKTPVVLTRGDRGLALRDAEGAYLVPGVFYGGSVDPVGAGDCMVSALACCAAAGVPLRDSVRFANYAAAVTVRKRFETGTASPDEIRAIEREGNFRYAVDVADAPRSAVICPGTTIELVRPSHPRGFPRHVVFDNDGTISTLREGWEPVMEDMAVEAVLGEGPANAALVDRVRREVRSLIEGSTGIRTIEQMRLLVGLIREHRRVPAERILDPAQYKRAYLERLSMKIVSRLEGIKSGRYSPQDFLIKGAAEFLEVLFSKGVMLYLASGTDVEAVRNELSLLGVEGYFKGRIYGAEDGASEDPKRMALERIMADFGRAPGDTVAVFGDGPVEMREARKRGLLAVGVASDEARRLGFNSIKRRRLVEGGADALIPDFSDPDGICKALGWPSLRAKEDGHA